MFPRISNIKRPGLFLTDLISLVVFSDPISFSQISDKFSDTRINLRIKS